MGLFNCFGIDASAALPISTPSGLNPGDQFRIVFWTVGTTQATGLWSGSLLAPINEFLTASYFFDTSVWTGTLLYGSGAGSCTLGSNSGFGRTPGVSNKSDNEWVETVATPSSFSNALDGISHVLTAVAEPTTSARTLVTAIGGGLSMCRRRKWD